MADPTEPLDNGVWETYTLKVGQADARLIIADTGESVLVDADLDEVGKALDEVFEERDVERTSDGKIPIDLTITTHLDKDHVWGYESLYEDGYEIQNAAQPDMSRFVIVDSDDDSHIEGVGENIREKFVNGLTTHGIDSLTQLSAGEKLPSPLDDRGSVFAPPSTDGTVEVTRPTTGATVNFKAEQANENGVVFKIDDDRSALFMGDVQNDTHHYAESWLIEQHDTDEIDLDADVLFVSHHGSKNATSAEFLDRVDPEVAVISSSLHNKYTSENKHDAHPHDATLKRLHDREIDVYWTSGHGTTRTELNVDGVRPEPTTDLETTNAADVAALKYYCREHEIDPKTVGGLPPDNLPEETPEWAIDAAPIIAETSEQFIDKAIENAESVEDLRQALDPTPDAHGQLRETVQADREEHVTTRKDVKRNKETYFSAKRAEDAYKRLPLHTRLRANLPNRFGGIEHPLADVPSSDAIDGPRDVRDLPKAVKKPAAAEQRSRGEIAMRDVVTAEKATDNAVEGATTAKTLRENLRETPGAHKDFLYAIENPNAHDANKSEKDLSDWLEQTNQREQTSEQTLNQDSSLGL